MARNHVSVLLAVGLYGVGSTAQTTEEPCAAVAAAYADQIAAAPDASPTIAASVAYDCLQSVPLGKAAALEFVEAMEPYLEWQSDTAYKANPPADYSYPGYDALVNLAAVKTKLENDEYSGEYGWQDELYRTVFGPAHDGHFVLYPDLLSIPFDFGRTFSLVSISEDQSSLPEIKVYEDVLSSPSTASVVRLINGVDAATFLEEWVFQASWNQDADAAYNGLFFQYAVGNGFFKEDGRLRYIYPGATTNVTFANGTEATMENYARIKQPFDGITDGASAYEVFCNPAGFGTAAAEEEDEEVVLVSNTTIPGYPTPIAITGDAVVAGFYLEGEGFEDVAVIALSAFSSQSPAEFQATSQLFLDQAVADGKTKLVIDFQGNGGGYILQGYDFFRQLFPTIMPDGFSRWKGSASYVAISQAVSDAVADVDPYTSPDEELVTMQQSWFNYRSDLNLTNEPFPSLAAKLGPVLFAGTNYTDLLRWNLTDPLTTSNATVGLGIHISGFGPLANLTQPFAAENIVMLYDGVCASTCTLASEMLRLQGGVRGVALGGRPAAGPIQGVGGVKGAQVLEWGDVHTYTQWALAHAPAGALTAAQVAELRRYSDLPVNRSTAAALNTRDQILRGNVGDGLPAQYVREEVDCRLYWTAAMLTDITAVWKAVADAAFHGAACAHGGISAVKDKRADEGVKPRPGAQHQYVRRTAKWDKRALPATTSAEFRAKHVLKAIK